MKMCHITVKNNTCNTAHIAISLSFSLSMFSRAAVRDFFSAEHDPDWSCDDFNDGEHDFRCFDRETGLRDRDCREVV